MTWARSTDALTSLFQPLWQPTTYAAFVPATTLHQKTAPKCTTVSSMDPQFYMGRSPLSFLFNTTPSISFRIQPMNQHIPCHTFIQLSSSIPIRIQLIQVVQIMIMPPGVMTWRVFNLTLYEYSILHTIFIQIFY